MRCFYLQIKKKNKDVITNEVGQQKVNLTV